jgi:AcrR family transcriptional regulator
MQRDRHPLATRRRILAAAGALFAERGFRGATMREIAQRARVNLASAHYHFGSKQALYLEVVRGEFEKLEKKLAARAASPGASLDGLSRSQLEQVLRRRVETMLETVLDAGSIHGAIMQREMTDPSDALPVIVKQFIDPMRRGMDRLVARLAPELSPDEIEHCTRSLVGQTFFYLTHRAALLLLMDRKRYPRGIEREASQHITAFSLGGLDRLAGEHRAEGARHAV